MIRELLIPLESSRKRREKREIPVKGPYVPFQIWVLGQLHHFLIHPRKTSLEQKIRVNGMRKLRIISYVRRPLESLEYGRSRGEKLACERDHTLWVAESWLRRVTTPPKCMWNSWVRLWSSQGETNKDDILEKAAHTQKTNLRHILEPLQWGGRDSGFKRKSVYNSVYNLQVTFIYAFVTSGQQSLLYSTRVSVII